ncbi:MAG: hypothetical protein NTW87_10505 [Planctomycetota bacterium]|nr:hypothetical protein [Planctomycetota bacterium]
MREIRSSGTDAHFALRVERIDSPEAINWGKRADSEQEGGKKAKRRRRGKR